jgi:ATP-dependent exoDNAse (exonuclease V) beta subunit
VRAQLDSPRIERITDKAELEWRLLYALVVAGKSAKFADAAMKRWWDALPYDKAAPGNTPFFLAWRAKNEDESIPSNRLDADVEEERRLAFVAITRAREAVYVSHALSRATPWKQIAERTPSRFIKEILP